MANDIKLMSEGEIVLYQPDENIRLEVRINNDTVWLTRQQMATLFGRDVKTIGKHINNALREELAVSVVAKNAPTAPIVVTKNAAVQSINPVVAKIATTASDGKVYQYSPISYVQLPHRKHDRYLIIDETVYMLGDSLKNMGTSLTAIIRTEMTPEEILAKLD